MPIAGAVDAVWRSESGAWMIMGWAARELDPLLCIEVRSMGGMTCATSDSVGRYSRPDVARYLGADERREYGLIALMVESDQTVMAHDEVQVILRGVHGQSLSVDLAVQQCDDGDLCALALTAIGRHYPESLSEQRMALLAALAPGISHLHARHQSALKASARVWSIGRKNARIATTIVTRTGSDYDAHFLLPALCGSGTTQDRTGFLFLCDTDSEWSLHMHRAERTFRLTGCAVTLVMCDPRLGAAGAHNVALDQMTSERFVMLQGGLYPRSLRDWQRWLNASHGDYRTDARSSSRGASCAGQSLEAARPADLLLPTRRTAYAVNRRTLAELHGYSEAYVCDGYAELDFDLRSQYQGCPISAPRLPARQLAMPERYKDSHQRVGEILTDRFLFNRMHPPSRPRASRRVAP